MHDIVIHGGTVHDGLGSPPLVADVAIHEGRVAGIGHALGRARRLIDADGLAVAPGFIDAHSHSDAVPFLHDAQPFKLLQGVTTEIVGNCGFSLAPLSEEAISLAPGWARDLCVGEQLHPRDFAQLLTDVEAAGPTNHLAYLVGHSALRLSANGMDESLRRGALDHMCGLAAEAFEAGAIGFSSGLIYPPGAYAATEELASLAVVAHRYDRLYTTHLRDEGDAVTQALDEAFEIAKAGRIRVQISHCKVTGQANFGRAGEVVRRLETARAEGIDARGDQYPYPAGATTLAALLPPTALRGGPHELAARLSDAGQRNELRDRALRPGAMAETGLWRHVQPRDVTIVRSLVSANVGANLEQLASGRDPWEVVCELLVLDPTATIVLQLMSDNDVDEIMRSSLIAIGSDSTVPLGLGHPRTYGCFPRLLGEYVREKGTLGLGEAVRKMTSAVATHMGLVGRGILTTGAVADITVFDPKTVGHDGDYHAPMVPPSGIESVLLQGEVVVERGVFTGERKGVVLRA